MILWPHGSLPLMFHRWGGHEAFLLEGIILISC